MKSHSLFIDKGIINRGEALYILSLFHISHSIVDCVEATGTDVLSGEVYETPFLCGAVLTEQYDAVGTIATIYYYIHKQDFKVLCSFVFSVVCILSISSLYQFRIIMNVSNDFCPFLCWSI